MGQCFRTYLPPQGVFLHGYQFRITKWMCLHALQISRSVRSLSTTDSPWGVLAMDKPISSCMVVHFKNWIWNDMYIGEEFYTDDLRLFMFDTFFKFCLLFFLSGNLYTKYFVLLYSIDLGWVLSYPIHYINVTDHDTTDFIVFHWAKHCGEHNLNVPTIKYFYRINIYIYIYMWFRVLAMIQLCIWYSEELCYPFNTMIFRFIAS